MASDRGFPSQIITVIENANHTHTSKNLRLVTEERSWPRSARCIAVLALLGIQTASAAILSAESIAAWKAYTQAARLEVQQRAGAIGHFLRIDETEGIGDKVRQGEPVVFPVGHNPHKVPSALVHDWVGGTFIPNVRTEDILTTVRDYSRYREFYHPAVIESKLLNKEELRDRFSLVLMNRSLISNTALDGEYESSYVRVDESRSYCITETSRMHEIENYGTAQQRVRLQGEESGLIWKLFSITKFEERDGGVYIELEAIALSREIPASLRWVATPIVCHVSKNSLSTSLQQLTDAVNARIAASAQVQSGRNGAHRVNTDAQRNSSSLR